MTTIKATLSVWNLPWIRNAARWEGQKEIHGTVNNPFIVKLWARLGLPFRDDETPWCAAFVGAQLEDAGIRSTRSASSLSYRKFGTPLDKPRAGCIAVKLRYSGGKLVGGHVTFVVGKDTKGNLICLGGNQGDMVSRRAYPISVFTDFRWPSPEHDPKDYPLLFGSVTTPAGSEA